jgi:hypothetical protein
LLDDCLFTIVPLIHSRIFHLVWLYNQLLVLAAYLECELLAIDLLPLDEVLDASFNLSASAPLVSLRLLLVKADPTDHVTIAAADL